MALHPTVRRLPLNVIGDFYTLGHMYDDGSGWCGECLACEPPETEAPDLLAPLINGNFTTYFVKQPTTPDEIGQACSAIEVCCIEALRYGGTDPNIIMRLGNTAGYCDYILVDGQQVYVGTFIHIPWRERAIRWIRALFKLG